MFNHQTTIIFGYIILMLKGKHLMSGSDLDWIEAPSKYEIMYQLQ